MDARLIVVAGTLPRREFVLDQEEMLIGRDSAAFIRLESPVASRRHCLICHDGDQYLVRDLGSQNGTVVNDLQVSVHVLNDDDRITIAGYTFVFKSSATVTRSRP